MAKDEKENSKPANETGYEEIDDEEMHALVLLAQQEALQEEAQDSKKKRKHRFPKWIFWLVALLLFFNTFSFVFQIYSIPAIDFLKTSARLSADQQIVDYSKSVVSITTGEGSGTGFSTSSDGIILTNFHVIEGHSRVTVAFPEAGRYTAKVTHTFPSIDLAVLEIDGENLPYLSFAEDSSFEREDPIQFIGNPLSFEGIANEGTIIDTLKLSEWDEEVVMIDAPVYRGNSGSPVFNKNGKVIGIIFATLDHPDYGTVGLFIPIKLYTDAVVESEPSSRN